MTIVFDVDSAVAQKRVGKEKDRLESEGLEFHNKVRMGYLKIAQEEPKRVRVVDANKSIEEVYEQTKRIVVELLKI